MDARPADSESQQIASPLKSMAAMQRLLIEAGGCEDSRELVFHILNRSVEFVPYDRAALWRTTGRRPALMGVSGTAAADGHSALAARMRETIVRIPDPDKPHILTTAGDAANRSGGGSALWLPLRVRNQRFAGLWLERWTQPAWTERDATILAPLATGYGAAFRPFLPGRGWRKELRSRGGVIAAIVAVALAALLIFVRAPLRIVAVCEVAPNAPYLVSAPMDGVIEAVLVTPGQEVKEGDTLFVYSGEMIREEYNAAWQQTEMARSDLERARAQAFADRNARAQVRILESRLKQEEARLAAAEFRLNRLSTAAERSGVALVGEPSEWRGRPVITGERVMTLIDPSDSKVRIWLPQDDRIPFDREAPVTVLLNAESGKSRQASLTYVAAHTQPGPEGIYGFMAEAAWRESDAAPLIGLRGTAVVYGERVRLGYWLLRKPLAALRRFLGV